MLDIAGKTAKHYSRDFRLVTEAKALICIANLSTQHVDPHSLLAFFHLNMKMRSLTALAGPEKSFKKSSKIIVQLCMSNVPAM